MIADPSNLGNFMIADTRRGRNIGVVAAAREQLELVYYGLRDHTIRAPLHQPPLHQPPAPASTAAA